MTNSAEKKSPFTWNGRPVRGLVFDMDGVIVDTWQAHEKAWGLYFNDEGIDRDPHEFLLKTFGRGEDVNIPYLYGKQVSKEFIREKATKKEKFFRDILKAGEVPLVKGVREFLEAARERGLPVAAGTSAPRENLDDVLQLYNLRPYFQALVSADEVEHSKPAPDIFLRCCAKLGLAPEDCVIFEDSIYGLDAAHAAGSRAVGVATTHTPEEIESHCDLVIHHFAELMEQPAWKFG